MDEIVLVGTSRQMHLDREPLTPHRALYGRNYLVVSHAYLDKRPVFHPFLVSLVHDATGYRPSNAFYLNAFLALLVVALAWGIGHALAGRWGAVFGTILLATVPLIPMLGSGGGFEMANLLWIMLFFLGVWAVHARPDHLSIGFLVLTTVLLAHLRYESALFVPFCGIAIAWAWLREGRMILPSALILAPLLLIDIPLQHEVFANNEGFWQLQDVEGAHAVFAASYVPTNLGHALNYFLSVEDHMPNTIPLFLLGTAGLAFTALLLRHWRGGNPLERASLVLWLGLLAQFALLMTYFWGHLDDAIIHRLSLPLWLWLWLGALFLLRKPLQLPRGGPILGGSVLLFWATFSLPLFAKAEYSTRHPPSAVFNRMAEWAGENQDGRTLVVSHNSVFWIGQDFAAMAVAEPAEDLPFLDRLLRHGIYTRILVSEPTKFDPEVGEYLPDDRSRVHEGVRREEIFRRAIDRKFGFRISRVTGIDPEFLTEEETGGSQDNDPSALPDAPTLQLREEEQP